MSTDQGTRRASCEEYYVSPIWSDEVAPTSSCVPPVFTVDSLPNGVFGTPYLYVVTGNGTPPLAFGAPGLPAGLAIDPVTGVISGTPTESGIFQVSILVSNGCGESTELLVTLEIEQLDGILTEDLDYINT